MITIDLNVNNTDGNCPVCNTQHFERIAQQLRIVTPTTLELDDNSLDAYCNECINGHKSVYIEGTQYKIEE
jgi:hypothetical protein